MASLTLGMSRARHYLPAILLVFIIAASGCRSSQSELAATVESDTSLDLVLEKAYGIISEGFNAGDGYSEVWIRDLATFIELSCDVTEHAEIRTVLIRFLEFQAANGEIVDGYVPNPDAPGEFTTHKNTVETDQESSLVQAVSRYIAETGDRSILHVDVNGRPVIDRIEDALNYVLSERFDEHFGLVWGATTADWGDVQPEHDWGVDIDENTHRAIDIYDNAMMLVAIDDFIGLPGDREVERTAHWQAVHAELFSKVRQHLWDESRGQFLPHIYLDESPWPADFDESAIYYHGGTAVAIEAGLLSEDEIRLSLEKMRANVKASGAGSIGLTLYPPYPDGFFLNPGMATAYSYQNGGDWTWFGGRMVQQLIAYGFLEEAYAELKPMTDRVLENDGFYEWYSVNNEPRGSGTFRGSAGVLGKAILMLRVELAGLAE